MAHVYLCHNGIWIDQKNQKNDRYDSNFIIPRASLNHSGNYSCVFSEENDLLPKEPMKGDNVIQILVIGNYLPADISIAGPSAVKEGGDVTFRCSVSDTLQTLSDCQFIHSHLRRNETLVQVQPFSVKRMEATFTIRGAVSRDTGNYSCAVLPSKCVPEQEETRHGNNVVMLVVKESLVPRAMVSCAIVALMSLVGLCLWWINKQSQIIAEKSKVAFSASFDAASRHSHADMFEEQNYMESQDGDSFTTEGEDYQNVVNAAVSINFDDCEGLYSAAEESTGAAVYSMPTRGDP
ncbi:uncharacterized protein LOC119227157 isoform X2 [Pungitius pungitius]|uniref:uncharacterized protein LOC119227157 isoform X2 n=1 Tax=Pungitius pungitius TaxID=134920 RepID=UPI002E127B89